MTWVGAVDSLAIIMEMADRIRHIRTLAGMNQETFAKTLGVQRGSVGNWELGTGVSKTNLSKIHQRFGVSLAWLMEGDGPVPTSVQDPASGSGAFMAAAHEHTLARPARSGDSSSIPIFGQAVAGDDGRLILNGAQIGDLAAPPSLQGVRDAYAVYVTGDSMEPRYQAGEAVYVHPRLPVRRGDYVVVQVAGDEGEAPSAFIKRYVSRDSTTLVLEQFNPAKKLRIPVAKVASVHRIVMAGDG